ncbi:Tubby-like F-box protein 3 [Zea mays]|uniref:Tubby-like F-box protein 3 n=1 Tax=Zea mays TaxID=4577 RepID=A0A1D6F3U3_MAIZE|nr:Tubby-like F-box protein 3 [Zea mays]
MPLSNVSSGGTGLLSRILCALESLMVYSFHPLCMQCLLGKTRRGCDHRRWGAFFSLSLALQG